MASVQKLLEARLGDAVEKSEKGMTAVIPFLTPAECAAAKRLLTSMGVMGRSLLWGGYEGAERRSLLILPDYVEGILPREGRESALFDFCTEEREESVTTLKIEGSGYRSLSHRDYLGAILNLGLERDALGDLCVQDDRSAVLFCSATVARFLCEHLERVANDAVKCSLYEVDGGFTDGKSYRPIADTVASERLDCVVAALCKVSREEAQRLVRTGLVTVEYEIEENTARVLEPPVEIAVRGYGKYILREFDGETRKGRLRLRADQLV